jgi:cytochrome c oxidase subunit 4
MSYEHDALNVTNPEHDEHHVVSPLQYTLVFATLITLTAVTVAAAYVNLGILNPIIALGIACVKGCVVVLFFMHVKYSSRLVKMTVFSGFFMFFVLVMMTLTDYMSRAWGRF